MEERDRQEIQRLSALLEDACHRSRRSRRDLERALGVGHGYLNHLFAGRMDLKVRHIFQILRELNLDPGPFLRDAFALPEAAPAPPVQDPAPEEPAARKKVLDRSLFKELLREIVRDELEEMATESQAEAAPPKPKPSQKKSP